jgi:hypothetical protein
MNRSFTAYYNRKKNNYRIKNFHEVFALSLKKTMKKSVPTPYARKYFPFEKGAIHNNGAKYLKDFFFAFRLKLNAPLYNNC